LHLTDTNHLNTPRLVADATGTTVWRWDQQEPFGNNPADEDPDANLVAFDLPLRLPGQRYDAESGLHYNYFRDYDTGVGRYVQSDPIGLHGGLNTYAYVAGNPLRTVDPRGEAGLLVGAAAVIGGYFIVSASYGVSVTALSSCVCDAAARREGAAKGAADNCAKRQWVQPGLDCSREYEEYARARRDKVMSCKSFATSVGDSMLDLLRVVTRFFPTL
jgi:RHS repeat-associated protein